MKQLVDRSTVAIARIDKQKADNAAIIDLVKEAAGNPIVELITGFTAVELLQNIYIPDHSQRPTSVATVGPGRGDFAGPTITYHDEYPTRPLIGPVAATTLYAGIVTAVAAQQVTKSLPYLAKSAEGMKSLAPLLAGL